jgi:hypothetical protein
MVNVSEVIVSSHFQDISDLVPDERKRHRVDRGIPRFPLYTVAIESGKLTTTDKRA